MRHICLKLKSTKSKKSYKSGKSGISGDSILQQTNGIDEDTTVSHSVLFVTSSFTGRNNPFHERHTFVLINTSIIAHVFSAVFHPKMQTESFTFSTSAVQTTKEPGHYSQNMLAAGGSKSMDYRIDTLTCNVLFLEQI